MCLNTIFPVPNPAGTRDFLNSSCHSLKDRTSCFHVTCSLNCPQRCSQFKGSPSSGWISDSLSYFALILSQRTHCLLPALWHVCISSWGALTIHLILKNFVFLVHLPDCTRMVFMVIAEPNLSIWFITKLLQRNLKNLNWIEYKDVITGQQIWRCDTAQL